MNILDIRPKVEEGRSGWLARSAPGSPLRIGVVAPTKEEAEQRFALALSEWAALLEQPPRRLGS